MFRNMVTSLFKYDRIQTTNAKAKELRHWADHLVTLAKRGDLHAKRQALAIIREKAVVYKLFEDAEKRFGKKSGGYTRVVKLGRRPGDAAPVSIIELVITETVKKKKKAVSKKTKPAGEQKAEKADKEGKKTSKAKETAKKETKASDVKEKEIPAEKKPKKTDTKDKKVTKAKETAKKETKASDVKAKETQAEKKTKDVDTKDKKASKAKTTVKKETQTPDVKTEDKK